MLTDILLTILSGHHVTPPIQPSITAVSSVSAGTNVPAMSGGAAMPIASAGAALPTSTVGS